MPAVFLSQGRTESEHAAAPRISVIIPVRTDAARLKLCLEALAASTFRDFEVIVANDASTDDTAAVAEQFGARVVNLKQQSGSAAARNAAARVARGDILLFIDADVLVHPNTLQVAADALRDTQVDAVFGSYDLEPGEPSLLSQYKNLSHRFFHQNASQRACTFWTGCGAVRRDVFLQFGGFNSRVFGRPSIEDIDLGVRMTRAGRRIVINRDLQAKHLKRWGLRTILKSDILDRAIPWSRLIQQTRDLPDDLNLGSSQRTCALLCGLFVLLWAAACWWTPWLLCLPPLVYGAIVVADRITGHGPVPVLVKAVAALLLAGGLCALLWYARWWGLALAVPLAGVVLLNARYYLFFLRHRGVLFTTAVIPMNVLYYLYSAAVFATIALLHGLGFQHRESMRDDPLPRPATPLDATLGS